MPTRREFLTQMAQLGVAIAPPAHAIDSRAGERRIRRSPGAGQDRSRSKVATPLPLRRRDARLMEALCVHDIDLAHQDVSRDLILGAAELTEGGQESEVVERLDRQSRAQGPCL